MCAGNLLALRQTNVKRILAYSSIAHFGYVLVAFLAATPIAIGAVSFIWWHILVTTLAAFNAGVVAALSGSGRGRRRSGGLPWSFLAAARDRNGIFTIALLFTRRHPHATMGFLGKFYVLASGADAGAWPLILTLVVTSVAGLFYYLRIVVALFSGAPEHAVSLQVSSQPGWALMALAILLIWLGVPSFAPAESGSGRPLARLN